MLEHTKHERLLADYKLLNQKLAQLVRAQEASLIEARRHIANPELIRLIDAVLRREST